MVKDHPYVRRFADLSADDVAVVGGKNASLGEMIRALQDKGIRVPDGFAITVAAYYAFLEANTLDPKIQALLNAVQQGRVGLAKAGKALRKLVRQAQFSEDVAAAVQQAYRALSQRYGAAKVDVAVRSSATAEDLPPASFAGQHDTYLNITGADALLEACRRCYASLFTDRAISYRQAQGFDHFQVALSVGVQKMVRADTASAGVMFSLDPETGFPSVVVINAAWGLGENVVQGTITSDQYTVFKPLLPNNALCPIIEKTLGSKAKTRRYSPNGGPTTRNTATPQAQRHAFVLQDAEIVQLARWACAIEAHYGTPMDIEWARDGETGEFYIVQARPETVHSQKAASALHTYTLKETGRCLLSGISIGGSIAAGTVCRLSSPAQIEQFADGAILVTKMTDPDWVPIMQRATGIITDYGGRTSHAAIVSRELGVPAIVGTAEATEVLQHGQAVTLSCAEGDEGYVYDGLLDFEVAEVPLDDIPQTQTRLMLNLASPAAAFRWWRLPCAGIGLARMEFIISHIIKIHPMALAHFDAVQDVAVRRQIQRLTRGYDTKTAYFVDHLARGIAKIAASQYPEPVIVRTSDFKTNEYTGLIGGQDFESPEENPMLGFRGAARYYSDRYQEGFALECQAIQKVRDQLGLTNVIVMIPFCRTLEEADRVLAVMAAQGLQYAIVLHADVLEEEVHQPTSDSQAQIVESITDIRTEVTRLCDMVQDYLTLLRLAGLQREPEELEALLQDTVFEVQEQAETQGVTLRLEGLAHLGRVSLHPVTLRRALLSLMQRALSAMPQGGTLTLRVHCAASQVVLEVRDTGSSIPHDQLSLLFEPFHTTGTTGSAWTGLRFYMVREIVAAHGGTVTVRSATGHGTTFTMTLPLVATASPTLARRLVPPHPYSTQ